MTKKKKNELMHHGIKGMKWGVRRFQNYDGSYTQAGLKRYREAETKYYEAEKNYKEQKSKIRSGSGRKNSYEAAKTNLKKSKKKLSDSYEKLKLDYKADKGKELYAKGKTITNNNLNTRIPLFGAAVLGTTCASAAAKFVAARSKNSYKGYCTGKAVQYGSMVVSAIISGKTYLDNQKLRAYYGHSNSRNPL